LPPRAQYLDPMPLAQTYRVPPALIPSVFAPGIVLAHAAALPPRGQYIDPTPFPRTNATPVAAMPVAFSFIW